VATLRRGQPVSDGILTYSAAISAPERSAQYARRTLLILSAVINSPRASCDPCTRGHLHRLGGGSNVGSRATHLDRVSGAPGGVGPAHQFLDAGRGLQVEELRGIRFRCR
jgi:hypothetical protein